MYNAVVNALKTSSDDFNRQSTGYKQYNVIPGWNDVCKEVHSNVRDAFLLWTRNGRPRSGYLLRNMQVTRATFKQALRRCRASKTRAHADSLARNLLLKDTKSFWTEIKKLSAKGTTPIASTINEITGTEAIAELWKTHYTQILNSVPSGQHHKDILDLLRTSTYHHEPLTSLEVQNAIMDLKRNKAFGLDTLSAEHFHYASNRLPVLLSLCLNAMVLHGHVPKSFSDTVLVPIIKDKKGDITDINNYRPIAITSVASKIFEKVILLKIKHYLCTNDNQSSYKPKHATDMCIFTLKSILDFYVASSSPVYLCYIDSSKAFDRVNFWCLFDKLIKRKVPVIFVRFFMVWYCTQEFVVRWGNHLSTAFTTSNGVRQGGILSPLFFNVYMDDLSSILNNAKVGCTINEVIINHLMYADDIVLIAPSIRAMQTLLNSCDSFAHDHNVIYSTKKTVCMFIRPKCFKSSFVPCLRLSGSVLKCVSSHKYLGVYISNELKDDASIRHQCRNMYGRGSMIIRHFTQCSDAVKCQLFQSFCTSFYCASLWSSYNIETLKRLKVAYNRIFRTLMGLQQRARMSENLIRRGLDPFKVVMRKLVCSFRTRIIQSNNVLLETIVGSMHFMHSKLTRKWNAAVLNLKP